MPKMGPKKEGGFTLVELLVVIVIISILAAVAIPMFTRHIRNSKAQEALLMIGAITEYVQAYNIAHLTSPSSSSSTDAGTWLNSTTGGDNNHYFMYNYTNNRIFAFGAQGQVTSPADNPFTEDDWILVTLNTQGNIAKWEASDKLIEVVPTETNLSAPGGV